MAGEIADKSQIAEQNPGMKFCDDRAGRVDPFAACEHDALGGTVLDGDALHRRAEPYFAAGRRDGAR